MFFKSFFAKRALRKALSNAKYEFRSLARLCAIAGRPAAETRALLYEIGARPAHQNEDLWGLCNRVGYKPRRRNRQYS